ncbi:shikimate dehydrogenase [Chelatococcus asaccharovorans]|jgi:shikimate dehydrogenase|uniref:shikimate dehydrogenase n=1 Tax=Chelatococcus asaccharovorans TaxID=28210 RepID=UPI00224C6E69|nr:shikimate dehydrogenase [Chelatococcus asaccharovorans]CAH1658208.1 Shikimate dehydrogenase (NADP(+)) [Chelatococcus asaccharovorans]CAH1684571.1 Shikimate dehydrogenase (NADP(+)) [Chelatococcus asaccharovorans]
MSATLPKACVIGHPIGHSRSPLIHGHWLREHGLAGAYEKVDVAPDDLGAFVTSLAERGYVGANVTVPHKEAVIPHIVHLGDTAAALDAANTLWLNVDGELCGDNTDVAGFLGNLDEGAPGWDARAEVALVLGAGGAAKAVVYSLLTRGVQRVLISNRSFSRAEALAERFRGASNGRVEAAPWQDIGKVLPQTKLLVNATSLGMFGQDRLVIDLTGLPVNAVVNDIVYVPLETELLAQARSRGILGVDGLGMLLHQAVPGFERWFGVLPRVTPKLREHIASDVLRHYPGN